MRHFNTVILFGALALATMACGYTDEEMAAKIRAIDAIAIDLKRSRAEAAEEQKKSAEAQAQMNQMRAQLKEAGIDSAPGEGSKQQQASLEYRHRMDQLGWLEARVRDLRVKLEPLAGAGVKVITRESRIAIQLPGDSLFEAGKFDLKPPGKEMLLRVADVLRADPELQKRRFVVAAHTDNTKVPGGGLVKDNWGLSLMRARQVLVTLLEERAADAKSPALAPGHWAAAGYGEADPFAGTVAQQTKDEQQKNRRVELVMQPSAEELLNLGGGKDAPAPRGDTR